LDENLGKVPLETALRHESRIDAAIGIQFRDLVARQSAKL
jgi:hypothetical protein